MSYISSGGSIISSVQTDLLSDLSFTYSTITKHWQQFICTMEMPSGAAYVRLSMMIYYSSPATKINTAFDSARIWVETASYSITNCPYSFAIGSTYTTISQTSYPTNEFCEYQIRPPWTSGGIQISFTAFDTELNYDYVTIFSASSENGAILAQYSTSTSISPAAVTQMSNTMSMTFYSDPSVTGTGWTAIVQSYQTPVITSLSPSSGLSGSVMTVIGSYFGSSPSITVGGSSCVTTAVNSTTAICTSLPILSGAQPVVITNVFVPSAGFNFNYISAPTLSSISPTSGNGGTLLTLTGSNFLSTSLVQFTNAGSCIVTSTSSTQLICIVPSYSPSSDTVYVSNGGSKSLTSSFTFIAVPFVTGIYPPLGQSGNTITLTGTNLGSTASQLTITVGGVTCNSIVVVVPNTNVTCVTASTGIVVYKNQGVGNSSVTFTYLSNPLVSAVTPTCALQGSVINITVSSSPSLILSATSVTVNNINCPVTSISGSSVFCTTSASQTSGSISALYYQVASTGSVSFTALTASSVPSVTGVLPGGGLPGSVITISGNNFGASISAVTVKVSNINCVATGVISTQIICTTSSSLVAGSLQNISVSICGASSNANVQWNVIPMVFSSFSPAGGTTGTIITLSGSFGFIKSSSNIAVTIGGNSATVSSATSTAIVVVVPTFGTGSNGYQPIVITNYATSSTQTQNFIFFAQPTITGITPAYVGTNQQITIAGANFGNVTNNLTVTLDDSSTCTISPPVTTSQIICTIGNPTEGTRYVTITRYLVTATSFPYSFVYYFTPVITSISPTSDYPGDVLTVNGNYGSNPVQSQFSIFFFNGTSYSCANVALVNNNELQCTIPARDSGNYIVIVTRVSTLNSNTNFNFTYNPIPIITSISPTSGSTGTAVTIYGKGLGSVALNDIVYFANVVPTSVTSVDPSLFGTFVVVNVPASNSSALSGIVNVTISKSKINSTTYAQFSLTNYPDISLVSPAGGLASTLITLTGNNFRPISGLPSIYMNYALVGTTLPCTNVSVNSGGTQITCNVPPTSVGSYTVTVVSNSLPSNVLGNFIYITNFGIQAPIPTQGPAGTTITITSSTSNVYFGNTSAVPVSAIGITIGGLPCSIITSSYNTLTIPATIQCNTIGGLLGTQTIVMTLFNNVQSSNSPFAQFTSLNQPSISGNSPSGGQINTVVVVSGGGFGTLESALSLFLYNNTLSSNNNITCTVVPGTLSYLGTSIACTIASSAPYGLYKMIICVSGDCTGPFGSLMNFYYIPTPTVTQVSPIVGQQGTNITITGTGFSTTTSIMSITVGGNNCPIISSTLSSTTTMICTVPAGVVNSAGSNVIVTQYQISSVVSPSSLFQYLNTPVIVAVSPTIGGPSTIITITGSYFGTSTSFANITASVGPYSCTPLALLAPNNQFTCQLSSSAVTGSNYVVSMSLYGYASSPNTFTYQVPPSPTVTSSYPPAGTTAQIITVTGTNFGTSSSLLSIFIGGLSCVIVPGTLVANGGSSSSIQCYVPISSSGGAPFPFASPQNVTVSIYGITSVANVLAGVFTYIAAPYVTSVSPNGGQAQAVIVVTGTGFGSTNSSSVFSITVGGVICVVQGAIVTQGAAQSVSCIVPSGALGVADVIVNIYQVASSESPHLTFTYINTPVIQSVSPSGGIGTGTSPVLTIIGVNFGNVASAVFVTVGNQTCQLLTGSSYSGLNAAGTMIFCNVPSLPAPSMNSVLVSIYCVMSQSFTNGWNQILSPTLSSILPSGGQASTIVTITGTGFGTVASNLVITVGGSNCLIYTSTLTTTSVQCSIPTLIPSLQSVTLSLFNVPSSNQLQFNYISTPQLTSVSPIAGTFGEIVTLSGLYFGSNASTLLVYFGSVLATISPGSLNSPSQYSTATLLVTVPPSSGGVFGNQIITISNYGIVSQQTNVVFNYLRAPVISQIIPDGGSYNSYITITADNLGSDTSAISATICNLPVSPVYGTLSGSSIEFQLPNCPFGNDNVTISYYGVSSAPSTIAIISSPLVYSVTPAQGPIGTIISVVGTNLFASSTQAVITVGDVVCAILSGETVVNLGNGMQGLNCTVPSVSSTGVNVVSASLFGVLSLRNSNGGDEFNIFNIVALLSVSPIGGQQGFILTLNGISLGSNQADITVTVGGNNCPLVPNSLTVDQAYVQCYLPPPPSSSPYGPELVIVTYYSTSSTQSVFFNYIQPPMITSIYPLGGESSGMLTIYGLNFGTSDLTLLVSLGSNPCSVVPFSLTAVTGNPSVQYIICSYLNLPLGSELVTMSNYFVSSSNSISYTITNVPIVTQITPGGGLLGSSYTIFGTNFPTNLANLAVSLMPVSNTGGGGGNETSNDVYPIIVNSISNNSDFVIVTIPLPCTSSGNSSGGNSSSSSSSSSSSFPCTPGNSIEIPVGFYDSMVTTFNIFNSALRGIDIFEVADLPLLTNVNPLGGVKGTLLTIYGFNFGSASLELNLVVTVGDAPCSSPNILSLSNPSPSNLNAITCSVTSNYIGFVNVTVARYSGALVSRTLENAFELLLSSPLIESISPNGGSTGTTTTIDGANFGIYGEGQIVYITNDVKGQSVCTINLAESHFSTGDAYGDGNASIVVTLPTSSVSDYSNPIRMIWLCRFNGSLCSNYYQFTLAKSPELGYISPALGIAGNVLTLYSVNIGDFGTAESELTVFVGNSSCPIVTGSLDSQGTKVSCTVPVFQVTNSDTSAFQNVTLFRFELPSNSITFEYILTPVIVSVEPNGGQSGSVITITGVSFGDFASELLIYLGNDGCLIQSLGVVSLADDYDGLPLQYLVCQIYGTSVGPVMLQMKRLEVYSNFSHSFLLSDPQGMFEFVLNPVVIGVSPHQQWADGLISMTGRNFLPPNWNDISVTGVTPSPTSVVIGKHPCVIKSTTDSLIVCRVYPILDDSDAGFADVIVSVFNVTDERPHHTLFYLVQSQLYYIRFDSPVGAIYTTLAVLTVVVAVVLSLLIWLNRADPLIRASSPAFLVGVMIGIIGYLVGIIVQEGPPSPMICKARAVIPSMFLTVILANLFVKTWRVWRIFDNKRLKRVAISNWQLLQMILALLFIEAILFISWFSTDPPVPHPYFSDWTCYSGLENDFNFALYGYKLLLLAFGAFLGYNIRNVQLSHFNESRQIAFSIYNILFTTVLVLIVDYNITSLESTFIVTSSGTLFIVWGILATLFVPKVYAIYISSKESGKEGTLATGGAISSMQQQQQQQQLQMRRSSLSISSSTSNTNLMNNNANKSIDDFNAFAWD